MLMKKVRMWKVPKIIKYRRVNKNMDLKEETTLLRVEVERLTNFVNGIEYDDFVNQDKIMETQDIIKFLLERLFILSWELGNSY